MERGLLLLLFLLIFGICRGQVLQDIEEIIERDHGYGCDTKETEVLRCQNPAGDVLNLETEKILSIGSSCQLPSKNGEDVTTVICTEDGFLVPESSLTKVWRTKRQVDTVSAIVGGVVEIAKLLFGGSGEQKEPNRPPTLHCPVVSPQIITAAKGADNATVGWSAPTATDPETKPESIKITQSPPDFKSGKTFPEGRYTINFMAEDTDGGSATCSMQFEVKVIRCNSPRWPENGNLICTPGDYRYGSTCQVNCLDGYGATSGYTKIACEKAGFTGQWDRPVPNCSPKSCQRIPVVSNGRIDCPDNKAVFGVTCAVVCDDGYKRVGSYFVSCDKTGAWETVQANCTDAIPPAFDPSTCPENIVVSTDSTNNTALVKWDIPTGTDNSGDPVTVKEIHNLHPNTRFLAGTHLVRYTITDSAGNVGPSCGFSIKVQTISCDPPNLQVEGASHMVYDCPSRYRYGAECTLSCKSGYPLGGTNKIQCMKEDENSDPPKLRWGWPVSELGPFCKESKCEDLRTPKHGATACDLWIHGRMCQIQCQADWDFAYNFPDLYVCGTNTGQWKPYDLVPDCIRKVAANHVYLKADIYYYTGVCNSSKENLRQIQTNFIKALNSSQFSSVCVDEPFCTAEFVNVTCGPTSRRKRDVQRHHFQRRSTWQYAYKVTMELIVPLTSKPGQSASITFAMKANLLSQMALVIEQEIRSSHFDMHVTNMHLADNSFSQGLIEYKCPKGMRSKVASSSCTGCPVGMYMLEPQGKCVSCPVGTYQDAINSVECKSCPVDTSTLQTGSVNNSQCIGICERGTFSITGLQPCVECSTTAYQPNKGQKSCIKCKSQKRTLSPGAASKSSCQAYDVLTNTATPVTLQKVLSSSAALTYAAWISLRKSSWNEEFFRLAAAQGTSTIVCKYTSSIEMEINGQTIPTGLTIQTGKWKHLAIVLDSPGNNLRIYIDGNMVFKHQAVHLPLASIFSTGANISIQADLQLSSLYLLERNAPDAEIASLASSCLSQTTQALVTLDNFADLTNTKVVMPSMCDDTDNCVGNPCGSNTCIDLKGGYECVCTHGYSGTHCQIPPDYCLQNSCQNGARCVNGKANYTCVCQYGFHGAYCESKAVDGSWSQWTAWSICSASCGGGISYRTRRCDSPPPDPEGKGCVGSTNETQSCKKDACPECLPLRRSFGAVLACNKSDGLKKCVLSCRPGMYLMTPPLLSYDCGALTNYKWTHQTTLNPTGKLPSCSYVKPPSQVVVKIAGEYLTFQCDTLNVTRLSSSLLSQLNHTACMRTGNCTVSVASKPCPDSARSKRSGSTNTPFSVEIKMDIDTADYSYTDLQNFFSKRIASLGLLNVFKQMKTLDETIQDIYQDSKNLFGITLPDQSVLPTPDLSRPDTTIICPEGTIQLDYFCAVVPPGSYIQDSQVHFCPVGKYQNESGSSECKICPTGTTTSGIGSESVSDCIPSTCK